MLLLNNQLIASKAILFLGFRLLLVYCVAFRVYFWNGAKVRRLLIAWRGVSHERIHIAARHRIHVLVHVVANNRRHHKRHLAAFVATNSRVVMANTVYLVVIDYRMQVALVVILER